MHTGGMARVIAGESRGRRLAVPAGRQTRPTSDRAREGLFGTICSIAGPLAGARVLDLYAGSGAVGLEALSRGAAQVTLVEAAAPALRVIRANVAALGLDGAEVVADRVERFLGQDPGSEPYHVVFADPPYATPDERITAVLTALAAHAWLASGALVVVERATRSGALAWPGRYVPDRARRYGEATFWYGLARDLDLAKGSLACNASSAQAPLTRLPTATSTSSAARPACTTRSSWRC
jgi:16S rRNA (guanine966-N2)-methyltransferase